MNVAIKIIGVLFIVVGIVYLLRPDIVKAIIRSFKKGKRIYLAGLVRLVLAVVFLLAARECDIVWVIVTFGIVFLISGLLIFMLGSDRFRTILAWWEKQSPLLLRLLGLVALVVGAIITYSA